MSGVVMSEQSSPAKRLSEAYLACEQAIAGLGDDRRAALSFTLPLLQAMRDGQSFWASVQRLLQIAQPGRMTEEEFKSTKAEVAGLTKQAEEIAAAVKAGEELLEKRKEEQQRLDSLNARLADLRRIKAEMERIDVLAAQVEPLRQQVAALDKRVALTDVRDLLPRLDELAPVALKLSQIQQEALGQQVMMSLAALTRSEQQIAEQRTQLLAARARWEQAGRDLAQMRDALEIYCRADRAIAEAVPGAFDALTALKRIQGQLEEIDQPLQAAIKANNDEMVKRLVPIDFTGARLNL